MTAIPTALEMAQLEIAQYQLWAQYRREGGQDDSPCLYSRPTALMLALVIAESREEAA